MRYRILGQTGLRVSAAILGTGNFGTGWGYGAEPDVARAIYDAYRGDGGNVIDTANNYQFGQAESLVGEFIARDRDDVIVATKYSLGAAADSGLQATGNSRKAMVQSVEASLRRLKTDHVDLLWVHMPDAVTPTDEILRGLEDLIRTGKIHYAGLSDFPAWRVARAATLAEVRGWSGVAAIQVEYSLAERSAERELLPMAEAFGLGVAGWSPLGGGLLTGKYRRGETGRAQGLGVLTHAEDDARKVAILDTLTAIAQEADATIGQAAIAWVLAKGVQPILGPRTLEQYADNRKALDVRLTAGQVARLDAASAIDLGFPHAMLSDVGVRNQFSAGKLADIDLPARPVL